jgi:UDP-N-acetylglucosamine 4,6-dehydratase
MYVIRPNHPWWHTENWSGAKPVSEGFRYTSDTNEQWLTPADLQEFIAPAESLDLPNRPTV